MRASCAFRRLGYFVVIRTNNGVIHRKGLQFRKSFHPMPATAYWASTDRKPTYFAAELSKAKTWLPVLALTQAFVSRTPWASQMLSHAKYPDLSAALKGSDIIATARSCGNTTNVPSVPRLASQTLRHGPENMIATWASTARTASSSNRIDTPNKANTALSGSLLDKNVTTLTSSVLTPAGFARD
jgi:hypothetical protein